MSMMVYIAKIWNFPKNLDCLAILQTSDRLLNATISASPKFIAFEKNRAQCSEWKDLTNKVSVNGTMEYHFFKYDK